MKNCRFCAEMIQDAAIKCRYCGSMLIEERTAGLPAGSRSPIPQQVRTPLEPPRPVRPFHAEPAKSKRTNPRGISFLFKLGLLGVSSVVCYRVIIGMQERRAERKAEEIASTAPSTGAAQAPAQDEIRVPADPGVRYVVLEKAGTLRNPTLITRREGPSGTSFSKRVFDCVNRTGRYLAEGDSFADLSTPSPNSKMGPLVVGSSMHATWVYACGR